MILCGHSMMWLALVMLVGLVTLGVVFSLGYLLCADRWVDRSKP